MRRVDEFVLSHRPYAVDLSSLHTEEGQTVDGGSYWRATANAVWFRRRRGVTVACAGYLWDYQRVRPLGAEQFLRQHDDGRHGGTCEGRWDGTGYWGAEQLDTAAAHLAVLRPMLDNYPEIPAGYDGWWTFHTHGEMSN